MSITSKLAALSVTYPYQVIRSRIQVRVSPLLSLVFRCPTGFFFCSLCCFRIFFCLLSVLLWKERDHYTMESDKILFPFNPLYSRYIPICMTLTSFFLFTRIHIWRYLNIRTMPNQHSSPQYQRPSNAHGRSRAPVVSSVDWGLISYASSQEHVSRLWCMKTWRGYYERQQKKERDFAAWMKIEARGLIYGCSRTHSCPGLWFKK